MDSTLDGYDSHYFLHRYTGKRKRGDGTYTKYAAQMRCKEYYLKVLDISESFRSKDGALSFICFADSKRLGFSQQMRN